jgi:ABC-type branched-subunit amino acid transport system substrate-binding protein
MLRSSQMAVFEFREPSLELLPYDTRGDAEGAERAAKLAVLDGAALILGPLLASSVRAIAPLAAGANVPIVTFSSDSRVAGGGTYVMGFAPELEVQRILGHAVAHGAQRFAVLAPDDAYGTAVVAAAQTMAAANGATIAAIEMYSPKTRDFGAVVNRLAKTAQSRRPALRAASGAGRASTPTAGHAEMPGEAGRPPVDAVLIADGGERLRAVASHLPAVGLALPTVRILGTGAWDEPTVGSEPALVGGWFAAPAPRFRREFEQSYQAAFGTSPARLATLAFDATAIAVVVAREHSRGIPVDTVINDQSGFIGRDGLFRFDAAGLADRRLAVLEVQRQGVAVVSEPQLSFVGS